MAKKKTYILEHNDPELWHQIKIKALEEKTTVKDKILELLKKWMKE